MAVIDIITGFLGAGKTTLINKLLAEGLGGEGTALIENEFGDVAVDDQIIEDHSIQMRTLATGCICCTLKGDFVRNLVDIVDTYHPERIIIEPTGLANLADMLKVCAQAGEQVPLSVGAVITVVNAENLLPMLSIGGDFFTEQLAQAHFIVMSCTQLVDEETLAQVKGAVLEQQPDARILARDWDDLDALEVMTLAEEVEAQLAGMPDVGQHRSADAGSGLHSHADEPDHYERDEHGHDEHDHSGHDHDEDDHDHDHEGHDHEGHGHHHVHEQTGCSSCAFFPDREFSEDDLEVLAGGLASDTPATILRAKGFLKAAGGGYIRFEYVPGRTGVQACSYTGESKFVVIGRDLDEEALRTLVEGGAR